MDPLIQITHHLAEVRRRLRLLHLVRDGGVLLSGLAFVLLLLALAAAGSEYLVMLRVAGGALVIGGVLLFGAHLLLRLRQLAQLTAVARHVGEIRPTLLSDLLSTVELGGIAAEGSLRFSRALYLALAADTWSQLQRDPPSVFVPAARLRPTAILLAVAAVVWAGAATGLAGELRHGAAKLFASRPPRERLTATGPVVGDLLLTLRYPQHMGRPAREVPSSTGSILAPRGTLVRLSTTSLVPAAAARLLLTWNGDRRPARLELAVSKGQLDGRFVIAGEGSYRFEIQTSERRTILDPLQHRIEVEPDTAPRATLHGPQSDLEVTPRHRLEIGYAVEDDYGVTAVDLWYQVGTRPPEKRELWRATGNERKRTAMGRFEWDLGLVELVPGARITYWLEAMDNDAVSGPKRARSLTRQVRVYSAEEKHARTLAEHQALVEQSVRILADRLLLFEKEPDLSPVLRLEKSHSVHRAQGLLVDGLRELRNHMRQDQRVSATVLRAVSQLQQRMAGLVDAEGTLLKGLEGSRRRHQVRLSHLGPVREHNRELVSEMERDLLRLANLLHEQQLQGLMTVGMEIRENRRRLAELLERYRKTPDEKLRQEILRQIQRMEHQVSDLLAQVAELRTTIPDEYLNPEAMSSLDLPSSLRQLKDLLQQRKLSELDASLAALDQKLSKVQSLLQENVEEYRSKRMTARERAYSELVDHLREIEAEERKMAERTGQVVKRYRKRAAGMMRSTIQPFVRRELVKVEALRRRAIEIESKGLGSYDQEQLERVKQRVDDLRGMLEQGDLEEGLQMARRATSGLQLLQDDLTDEVDGAYSARRSRLARNLGHTRLARGLGAEVVSDLEAVFPSPRSLLDGEDRKELADVLKRQQGLHKRAEGLAARLEKDGRTSPLLGPELPRGIRESSELMGKASDKLRGLLPQEAQGAQETAADQLAQLQKQLQAARQPREWAQSGAVGPREKIAIPGADAFQPPRAFREDILDAMKEKPPRVYRHQVKEYYEELVR
jgi:hypothetical protein